MKQTRKILMLMLSVTIIASMMVSVTVGVSADELGVGVVIVDSNNPELDDGIVVDNAWEPNHGSGFTVSDGVYKTDGRGRLKVLVTFREGMEYKISFKFKSNDASNLAHPEMDFANISANGTTLGQQVLWKATTGNEDTSDWREYTYDVKYEGETVENSAVIIRGRWKSTFNFNASIKDIVVTEYGNVDEPSVYTAIDLSATQTTAVAVNSSANITVNGITESGAAKLITSGVTFKSSNPEIATVGSNGNVKGVAKGISVITAEYTDDKYGKLEKSIVFVVGETIWGRTYDDAPDCDIPDRTASSGNAYLNESSASPIYTKAPGDNSAGYLNGPTGAWFPDSTVPANNTYSWWFYDDGTTVSANNFDTMNIWYKYTFKITADGYSFVSDYRDEAEILAKDVIPKSKGWHQVLARFTKTDLKVYIDGELMYAIKRNQQVYPYTIIYASGSSYVDDFSSVATGDAEIDTEPTVSVKPSVSASSEVITRKNATVLEKVWDYTAYLYSTVDFGNGYELGDFGFELVSDGYNDEEPFILPVVIDENGDKTPEAFAIRVVGNNIAGSYTAVPYIYANGEKITGKTITFTLDENTQSAE